MEALQAAIDKTAREIDEVEAEAKTAVAQGRGEDARRLYREEEQLRIEKQQLGEKELIALRASGKQYQAL